jgi:hypothetical protein
MTHGMGASQEVEVDSSLTVDIVLDLAAGNLTPCDNQQESWDHNVEAEHMHSFAPVLARSSFRLEYHRAVAVLPSACFKTSISIRVSRGTL